MNKYLEKVAQLTKLAWDSDYEANGEYGVASNRSIGNDMVHDMLLNATKDPHVVVGVDELTYHQDPEKFRERMAEIREEIGPKKSQEQHNKDRTMDWHRDHSWSLGMKKDHPILKTYIGKEDKWGDVIEDEESAILHHLEKVHKY